MNTTFILFWAGVCALYTSAAIAFFDPSVATHVALAGLIAIIIAILGD